MIKNNNSITIIELFSGIGAIRKAFINQQLNELIDAYNFGSVTQINTEQSLLYSGIWKII